jgi:hypothetical protein
MSYQNFLQNYRNSNNVSSDTERLEAKQAEYLANKQLTKTQPAEKTEAVLKAEIKQSNTITVYGDGKKHYEIDPNPPVFPAKKEAEVIEVPKVDHKIEVIAYNEPVLLTAKPSSQMPLRGVMYGTSKESSKKVFVPKTILRKKS